MIGIRINGMKNSKNNRIQQTFEIQKVRYFCHFLSIQRINKFYRNYCKKNWKQLNVAKSIKFISLEVFPFNFEIFWTFFNQFENTKKKKNSI